jgi:hypothetical protein
MKENHRFLNKQEISVVQFHLKRLGHFSMCVSQSVSDHAFLKTNRCRSRLPPTLSPAPDAAAIVTTNNTCQ